MKDRAYGVKECAKFVSKELKGAKKELDIAKEDYREWGMYDDCGSSFQMEYYEKKGKFDALLALKIKLEKYAKKLGHEEREKYGEDPFMIREKTKERLKEEFKKYGELIIAYDFDYTVHSYHGEDYTYDFVINLLREWRPYAKFIVFTASPETRYDYIKEYLENKNIPYDTINEEILKRAYTRKVYYNVFLDDRAGLCETAEMLSEILEEIKIGKIKKETP